MASIIVFPAVQAKLTGIEQIILPDRIGARARVTLVYVTGQRQCARVYIARVCPALIGWTPEAPIPRDAECALIDAVHALARRD